MANKKEEKKGITYKGENYDIIFNLNVMEQIQEEYGSMDKWGELTDGTEKEVNAKALIFGLTCMINEGIDIYNEENGGERSFFSAKQVGRIVSEVGLADALKKVNNTVVESSKSDEKN